jgi:hypothetical protein
VRYSFFYFGFLEYADCVCDGIVDFEQPRALWQKVFDDGAKERFVSNIAGHLGGAKSKEIKARQRQSILNLSFISFFDRCLLFDMQCRYSQQSTKTFPIGSPKRSESHPSSHSDVRRLNRRSSSELGLSSEYEEN